jgi:hypothetical protein
LVLRVLLVLPLPFVLGVLVALVVLHFLDYLLVLKVCLVLEDLVDILVVVVRHLKVQLGVSYVVQIMFGLVLGDQLPSKVVVKVTLSQCFEQWS